MPVHASYQLRLPLLCVDQGSRKLVSVDPGALLTHVRDEAPNMVALRFGGREVLAFAADLEDRADAVPTGDESLAPV